MQIILLIKKAIRNGATAKNVLRSEFRNSIELYEYLNNYFMDGERLAADRFSTTLTGYDVTITVCPKQDLKVKKEKKDFININDCASNRKVNSFCFSFSNFVSEAINAEKEPSEARRIR